MGIKRGSTLFEAVPALSARGSQTTGQLKLVPLSPEHPHVPLGAGRNLIGRDKEQVDHRIEATQISRVHCEINVSPGRITLHDLGSQNGTYVNGRSIQDVDLSLGDEIGISRSITFRLVHDQALATPHRMDLAFDEHEPTVVADASSIGRRIGEIPEIEPAAEARMADVTDHGGVQKDALAQERDLALILYQIALGCLVSDDQHDRETLLSNVLPRLAEMDEAFILHQSGADWRASICPTGREPSDAALKSGYRLARDRRAPMNIEDPRELALLGQRGGGAMIVPLLLDERLTGLVGVISHTQPFPPEALDAVTSFADICAAALRP